METVRSFVRSYAGHGRVVGFGSLLFFFFPPDRSHRGFRFGQIISQSTLQPFLTAEARVLFQAAAKYCPPS
jgi:hypothetical protein